MDTLDLQEFEQFLNATYEEAVSIEEKRLQEMEALLKFIS